MRQRVQVPIVTRPVQVKTALVLVARTKVTFYFLSAGGVGVGVGIAPDLEPGSKQASGLEPDREPEPNSDFEE